jgi:hypothetical protein
LVYIKGFGWGDLMGWIFFKGDGRDVLEGLLRYVEARFRDYVHNRLSERYSEGELMKILVEKLRLTPYRLLCINACSTYEDLVDLMGLVNANDPITQRYMRYIRILAEMIEFYDGRDAKFKLKPFDGTIIGYQAVDAGIDGVIVHAVILNLDNDRVERMELTELVELEDC